MAALILTIASCRPPHLESSESWRTTLILTIGPFLTAYALWGLLENKISDLFVINVALQGLGGYETWSVNLSRIRMYVILALVALAGRLLVAALARRRARSRGTPRAPPGAGWLPVAAIVLEGIWVVTSLLALFVLVRRAITWLQGRAVWSWVSDVWYQLLAWLPELRLPFDLTLPAAVAAASRWVWDTMLPGLSHAVLLPLMWLALTAIVLGWRTDDPPVELVDRTLIAERTRRWHSRIADRTVTPVWRLAIGTGRLLTSDLRNKYLPVLRALALTLRVGWRFVGAYLIVATAVETLRRFAVAGLDWVIGPQPATQYLARMDVTDLARRAGLQHARGGGLRRGVRPDHDRHRANSITCSSVGSSILSRTLSPASAGTMKATATA